MEKEQLTQFENKCIQEEAPYCQAACPIHVDARALCAAWADKDAKAARLILERTMPLPALTAYMCEAPCKAACLRSGFGGALPIGELERAAVSLAPRQSKFLRVPPKNKAVAVLGGGAAGLAASWDLAKKGWRVDLYQQPGPAAAALAGYAADCPAQHLENELKDLASLGAKTQALASPEPDLTDRLLQNHDAVLVDCLALDPAGLGLSSTDADPFTLQAGKAPIFLAGRSGLAGQARYIDDLCEGRRAATSIDRLLRGASLTAERKGEGPQPTRLETDASGLISMPPLAAADPQSGYTAQEAKIEAARCVRCECMQCVTKCVYLQKYGGYPKAYARRVYNNEAIVKGSRDANPLINSCSLCGQCSEICPNGFSMADLCLGARRRMVDSGHMPPSAHFLALKEMESAWEPWAFLARHAPGETTSAWLFFPGCQLSGLRPGQVEGVYDHLRSNLSGGVGLMLACCGAPAHWAGRQRDYEAVLGKIRQAWQDLDCPRVITGCTSCLAGFRRDLPEMDPVSLWELWQEHGAPPAAAQKDAPPLAMEDPCTTRDQPGIQAAARQLAQEAGRELRELQAGGSLTECCGFGGLMAEANPALADKVIKIRAAQSPDDYLTYCVMCRERLAQTGKRVLHLLDLYFPPQGDEDPAGLPPLGLSPRWDNRSRLREKLVQNLWSQEAKPDRPWSAVRLLIAPPVAALMDKRRILAEDLRRVLFQAAQDGPGFKDQDTGRNLVYGQLGPVTYWVEYTLKGGVHEVHRAWSHRMVVGKAKS